MAVCAALAGTLLLTVALLTPLPAGLLCHAGVAFLERQYGILGTVDGVEFDVWRLRVMIVGLRLAARDHPQEPFLYVGEARVDLPWSAIRDGPAIDELVLRRAAVAVIRRSDGRSNLPARAAGATSGPGIGAGAGGLLPAPAVPIGRLEVDGLTVDWRDQQAGFAVHLPPTAVDLAPRRGGSGGTVLMDGVAHASWRGTATQFTRLAGEVELKGSTVGLRRLALSGPDLALTLDGRVTTVLGEPRLALTYTADLDLAWVAALYAAPSAAGRLAAAGAVTGTPDRLQLSSVLAGAGIALAGVAVERIDAALGLTPDDVSLEALRVELAGGSVSAAGRVDRAPGWPGRLEATWSGLDVDRLLAVVLADPPLVLRSTAHGSLAARWPALDPRSITASAGARLLGSGARGAGIRLDADDGHWRLTLDQTLADVVSMSGALDARPGTAAGTDDRWLDTPLAGSLELTCVDLGRCSRFVTGAVPAATSALLGGTVSVRLDVAGSLGRPVASGRLEASGPTAGSAAATGLAARLHADTNEIRADSVRIHVGPNTATGRLRLQLPGRALDGAFTATVSDLAALRRRPAAGWVLAGGGWAEATIGGTLPQVKATAAYFLDGVQVSGRDLGEVDGRVVWVAGEALRADLRVPALGATVEASLHGAAGERRFRLRGRAIHVDLARLSLPAVPLTGRVTLAFAADGPLDNLAASALALRIDDAMAGVGGRAVSLAGPAVVSLDAAGLRTEDLELTFGRSRLEIDGGLPLDGVDTLTVALSGSAADLAAVAAPLGVLPPAALDGEIALDLAATGTLDAFDLTGSLLVEGGAFALRDHPVLNGIRVRAELADGMLRVESLWADWAGAAIDGAAELPLELGLAWLPGAVAAASTPLRRSAAARVEVTSLNPGVLAGFLNAAWLDQLAGRANATIELELPTPDLAAARGRMRLSEASFVVAGIPLAQRRATELVLEGGRVSFRAFDWGNATSDVVVRGHLPLDADAGADLSLAGRLDLRTVNALLPTFGVQGAAAAGSASVNVRLTGPLAQPGVSGRVDIAGVELQVAQARLALTDLAGTLLLADDRVTVADLTGSANGGRVAIGGGWSLAGPADGNRFTVTGESLALDTPSGLRSEADVDVTLAGDGGGLVLTGRVDLLRGAYREPFVLSGGVLELLGREPGVAASVAGGGPAPDVRLDLRVTAREDILIANNYVDAALGGDLRVGGTLSAPAVTGRAVLREGGRVRFGTRVYEIDTGVVDFVDAGGIVPALTLEAHTRAGGYDITLEAAGSAGEWTTSLRSEPPLPESDIASVLLTGRPLDQAPGVVAADARELALGLASGELLAQVGRGLGVDVHFGADDLAYGSDVLLDPSLIATHLNPASRLTVGRDLGENVRLVFSRGLRDDDMAWLVDYLPRRNIELRALFDDEQRRAYEFKHVVTAGASVRGAGSRGGARVRPEVTAVEFDGASGVDNVALRGLLSLGAGDTFDFRRWQDDRARLAGRLQGQGFLEARVRSRRTFGPDERTVVLTYQVERGPRTRLTVSGYAVPDGVRRDLEAIWTNAVFDTFRMAQLAARITAYLAAEGYLRATVDVRTTGSAGPADGAEAGVKEIVVRIERGPRSDERRLAFEGVTAGEAGELQALAKAGGLDVTAWTDPEPLVTAVLDWYRSQGRLRVSVQAGEPRFPGRAAELPVRVTAGPLYRVGRVRIAGTQRRSEAAARAAAAIAPGDVYTEAAVVAARRRIESSYRSAGYADVRVAAASVAADDSRTVEVQFEVVEGLRQVLDRVVVEGALRTHPTLVARALDLRPGTPVDPLAWNLARRRLYQTGVFRSVDIAARERRAGGNAEGDGSTPVEARVTLEEWPPYRLRYGLRLADEAAALGESTGRTLRVGAGGDLTRRNLFGRGLTTGVSALVDRGQQAVRAFLTVPTLFGRALETNLFVARRRTQIAREEAGVVTDTTTFTLEQRVRPRADVTVAYSANLDFSDPFDPAVRAQVPAGSRGRVARFDGSLVADTRDDLFDATAGMFHSSNVEYGSELGRPASYLKYLGQQFAYRRWRRVVLASAARVGLATGFGGPLHPTERFFAGGGNTVRGYRQDSLGPRHAGGGPWGGSALVVLNQEVRFPLWWHVSGVAFIDAGAAYESVRDITLRDLRVGTGFGLRFDTPLGLLRADYGSPLGRRDNEPRGRLFISLGQAF